MPVKDLSINDKLIYFLNDNGELEYLASACQNFIDWQNSFLDPIIELNKNGHKHTNRFYAVT